jgi:hypothetical protein
MNYVGDNECLKLDCTYHNLFHLANWKIWVPICWYGNYSIHISYETNLEEKINYTGQKKKTAIPINSSSVTLCWLWSVILVTCGSILIKIMVLNFSYELFTSHFKTFWLVPTIFFTAYQITAFNMRKRISLQIKMIKGGMACN